MRTERHRPYPKKGQRVRVLTGTLPDFSGIVVDVDEFRRQFWVVVLFFGRELSIGLGVLHVEAAP
jgi:transcription antitermination factor NusG